MVAAGISSRTGIAHVAGGAIAFVTATVGRQTTLVGLDNSWCSDYENCGGWWRGPTWVTAPADYAAYIHTDRPTYWPGHTVHDKVTLRHIEREGYRVIAAGAQVTLRVSRGYSHGRGGYQTGEYRGVLGAEGTWTTQVIVPGSSQSAGDYAFQAEVVDASRRPVVGESMAPVYPAAFDLGLRTERYGVQKGEPIELEVSTIGHDGVPAAGRRVEVQVRRYARYGYSVDRQERVTTGPYGTALVRLSSIETGWYAISAWATDDAGHRVEASSYAWVCDRAQPWCWWGGLEATADKDGYAPGEVAHLLVRSPVTTTAIITLERDEVYDEITVPVSGATTVDVPIKAEYGPSSQAKVHLWQPQDLSGNRAEGRLLTGRVALRVPRLDRRLSVAITPDAEQHAPGEEATFSVKVMDANGRPVTAQLSFALVDKAVLALAADRSGDILDAFWSGRESTVATYDSLTPSQRYARPVWDYGGQPPSPGRTATASPTGTPGAAPRGKPSNQASQAAPWALLPGYRLLAGRPRQRRQRRGPDHSDVAGHVDDLEGPSPGGHRTATTASRPIGPPGPDHWDEYRWRTMASTEKQTAIALEALSLLRPTSPLAAKAAGWLLENRWGRGWSSTQATSFAVLALTDYILASGELQAQYDWTVALDGRTVAHRRATAAAVRQRASSRWCSPVPTCRAAATRS